MAPIPDKEMAMQIVAVLSQLKFLARSNLLELPKQATDAITIEVIPERRTVRLTLRDRFYFDLTSENGIAALVGAGRVPPSDALLDLYGPIAKQHASLRRAPWAGRSIERTRELAGNVLAYIDRADEDQPLEDYRIVPFETASCWFQDLREIEQESNWCVPTCMAILSPAMAASTERDAGYYAPKWGQNGDTAFDMESMGDAFSLVCKEEKLLLWQKTGIDFDGICKLGKPTILMSSGDDHAEVLIGVTDCAAIDGSPYKVNGYVLIDPAQGRKQWFYCGPVVPCYYLVKPS
jgi:hypothetical protein